MAAVIDQRGQDPTEIPHMLSRFSQELPALLLVIDEAEAQPKNESSASSRRLFAELLCKFFFILQAGKGVQIMQRGAQIALLDGNMKPRARISSEW